ncbi:MAG: PLP-dependent transferase [Pseudomonadota bacterium]
MTPEDTKRIMAMLHAGTQALPKGAPISPPIVTTAKYALPGEPDTPYVYGRDINPTVEACEAALNALEAAKTVAFPTGMAAITAGLMVCAKPGDRIVVPSDGYFVTRALLDEALNGLGLTVDTMATQDFETADLSAYDLVWLETPSNPGLDLCDIAAVAAKLSSTDTKLVVDNTTLTPMLQRPLDSGADMVVASDTKAMAGHSDTLFGHIATRDETLFDKAVRWRKLSGAVAGPLEAFLVHRGLMTLELRLERMCSNARALETVLRPEVGGVLKALKYPAIGFILGLTFDDAETADAFINTCPAIFPSTSFGGVHTSAERRARWGDDVPGGYVRLSVGCEPEAELVEAVMATLATISSS